MMNMNENPFSQIQMLLSELSIYVNKVNEIIIQMNLIMNKMNYPIINQPNIQMNEMNNFMNMMNVNQMNLNNNIENNFEINKKKFFYNFQFSESNGKVIGFPFEIDKSCNDLFNEYCRRSNNFNFIDNYDNYIDFIFNASLINKLKEKKIKEVFKGSPKINVIYHQI